MISETTRNELSGKIVKAIETVRKAETMHKAETMRKAEVATIDLLRFVAML